MARTPSRIGKYTIESKIAEGGMGAVYKGTHPTLNRTVILKKLTLKGSQQFIERFRREAQIMMEFKNDNIVSVYDHFKAGDSYYIVLEYIDGLALGDLIRKERYLPEDVALYIFMEAAIALAYAHKRNVVHRDIKPANLLISSEGEIKLVDFGVAHMGDDGDSELTTDGMTIGTPSYMAPEQFKDSKNVDRRADIYSLGVMLYEMLTGKKPFPGNFSPEAIAKIQKGKCTPPRKHNPSISGFASRYIRKAMKVNPDKRFHNSDKIVSSMERYFQNTDVKQIQGRLKSLIAGEKLPETKNKLHIGRKIGLGAAAGFLVLAGLCSWRLGLFYEWFQSSTHGRFQIEITASAETRNASEIFRRIDIFEDDDDSIPAVQKKVLFFPRKKNDDNQWIFRSFPVYLPSGNYRMKIQVEEHLYWQNLFLPSRTEQKIDGASEKGEQIQVDISTIQPRPFEFKYTIRDRDSGRNLMAESSVLFQKGNNWIEQNQMEFISGAVYRIRFEREGYYSKAFHIFVAPYQEIVNLDVQMVPLPGTFHMDIPDLALTVTLNGKDYVISGSKDAEPYTLGRVSESFSVPLAPGNYHLLVKYRKSEVEREITIKSGATTSLPVKYNEESKEISIP